MFRPVGPQPPSVYWRRRLVLLAAVLALLVLLALTLKTIASGGNDPATAQGTAPTSGAGRVSGPASHSTASPTHRSSSRHSAASNRVSSTKTVPSHSTSAPPPTCSTKDLAVAAVAGKSSYQVGDQPLVELQVTNNGPAACVQDLADKQVELKVYNGESRVWGSHDCKIQPGTAERTLTPHTPVLVAITWSGLSSRPGCAGTRQRVGAGTYTLYATLAGKTGKAAQFSIG